MGILSDDEARRFAEAMMSDIRNAVDVDEACNTYNVINDRVDHLMVGRHLVSLMLDEVHKHQAGDRSPEVRTVMAVFELIAHQARSVEQEAARPLPHARATRLPSPGRGYRASPSE
jgi:hypothetical protein